MMRGLLFVLLLIHASSPGKGAKDEPLGPWLTLNGKAPWIVAREGFSGQFPEDTAVALQPSRNYPISMLCSVQLTMDGAGVCQSDVEIGKSTDIQSVHPNKTKTYNVNGKSVTGYFTIDYTAAQLKQLGGMQSIWTRSDGFDGYSMVRVDGGPRGITKTPNTWFNVPYAQFYSEHKLSMEDFIRQAGLTSDQSVSSPEIGFLKAMGGGKLQGARLYFVFRGKDEVEPTTQKTYGSIASDLAALKPIVVGIVVPRDYIWPVDKSNYLVDRPTSIVADAHKLGLEVYASGFANDNMISYNYTYDPIAEYLNFIRNGEFAVDGVITDFPPTATNAISCFGSFPENRPRQGQPLVITNGGASGVYAPSTDLAYQGAIDDGADVIDCNVQMTKDGVAFCMTTPDLTVTTTAATAFMDHVSTVKELQDDPGIFSFDLDWTDIQSLQPQLTTPYEKSTGLKRNPMFKNKGKFVTLSQFLEFARSKNVTGVLINLDNAPYLASKGLDLVTTVSTTLTKAGYDKKSTSQVLIQSDDTSVLAKFKTVPTYKRVLAIKEEIDSMPNATVDEIKKHADGVTLTRYSIIKTNQQGYTTTKTNTVETLQNANLTVFVSTLSNEYITLAFDYFADPIIEIATYTHLIGINGLVTEYPKTASRYLRNPCSDIDDMSLNYTILPVVPGILYKDLAVQLPADPPKPPLSVQDVVDPPLPEVAKRQDSPSQPAQKAPTPPSPSSAAAGLRSTAAAVAAVLLGSIAAVGYN